MPLFDLECLDCGDVSEQLVRNGEQTVCPSCDGARLQRHIGKPAAPSRRGAGQSAGGPVNDGGPSDCIGNQAAAARARGRATCC